MVIEKNEEMLKCIYIMNNFSMDNLDNQFKTLIKISKKTNSINAPIFKTWLLNTTTYIPSVKVFDYLLDYEIICHITRKSKKIPQIMKNLMNSDMSLYVFKKSILKLSTQYYVYGNDKVVIYLEYIIENFYDKNNKNQYELLKKYSTAESYQDNKNKYNNNYHISKGATYTINIINKYL